MSRICYNGLGQDNTAALKTFLASTKNPLIKTLYLIGRPDDPNALWMTDYETPLIYSPYGKFSPAVVSRNKLTFKIGLDVMTASVTWAPSNRTYTTNVTAASPLQLAKAHFYDLWPVRIWKVYMPTPGDCNTIGAVEWFGGVVANTKVGLSGVTFNVKSYTYVLGQKVPGNVVEVTSTLGSYTAATAPPSSSIPVFEVVAPTTTSVITANCLSPTPGHVYDGGTFDIGYMLFLDVPGATLAGAWCVVGTNGAYTPPGSPTTYSQFNVYAGLPFPPTPGVDQFYISTAAPINLGDADYLGFPYVPDPENAA